MALPSKHERDKKQAKSSAKKFRLSKEDRFHSPTLEQRYWSNPNAQRGEVARCSYGSGHIEHEVMHSEGV